MAQLNISTGLKEYNLIGSDGSEVKLWINPTDTQFIDRLLNVFEEFEAKQEELKEKLTDAKADKIIEVGNAMDTEMREKFIEVFGKDIVTPLIGNVSLYALADSKEDISFPIWANILLAIMEQMENEFTEEQKKSAKKISKYTKKYKK